MFRRPLAHNTSNMKSSLQLLLLVLLLPLASSWQTCPSGAICPDENLCCGAYCLSGSKGSAVDSQCCDDEHHTGCGKGFECGSNETCSIRDPKTDDLPDHVPRYKLCRVEDPDMLQKIHGLPMELKQRKVSRNIRGGERESSFSIAAYLTNMGPVNSMNSDRLETVQHAVILIHGSLRNPDDYMCCTSSAIPDHQKNTTLLVAPWFLAPEDGPVNLTTTASNSMNHRDKQQPLRWVARGVEVQHTWRYGADAIDAPISSYAVVDHLISLLQDKRLFPSLQQIVVAGHSAGGQFAQRWGLLSGQAGSAARIVAANPKSFAYLDGRRFLESQFRVPTTQELNKCTSYNEWEWGFGNSTVVQAPYKDAAIAAAGGIDAVIRRYANREIIYLSGEQDILWNGYCEAMVQGPNRLTRSSNFFDSLKHVYGRNVHRRWTVPNVHHDHCLMFQSPQGQRALFGGTSWTLDES